MVHIWPLCFWFLSIRIGSNYLLLLDDVITRASVWPEIRVSSSPSGIYGGQVIARGTYYLSSDSCHVFILGPLFTSSIAIASLSKCEIVSRISTLRKVNLFGRVYIADSNLITAGILNAVKECQAEFSSVYLLKIQHFVARFMCSSLVSDCTEFVVIKNSSLTAERASRVDFGSCVHSLRTLAVSNLVWGIAFGRVSVLLCEGVGFPIGWRCAQRKSQCFAIKGS